MTHWLVADKNQLHNQIISNSLPHALIFSGVKGAGKLEIAQWLVKRLLCQQPTDIDQNGILSACMQCKSCHLFNSHSHPDHKTIELNGLTIGVDQVRTVSRFFEKTAQLGNAQTVIISNADKMTESAANALLKTLEEPTNNSYIILLVKDAERLLPTIISRCYQINLSPPIGEKLLNQLGQQSSDPFVNLTQLSELTDPQVQLQYQSLSNNFINFLVTQQKRMMLLTELMASEHSIRWLEKVTVDLLRGHHKWHIAEYSQQNFIDNNADYLWRVYKLITVCSKQQLVLTQLNKEYSFEKLLVDIAETI